MDTNAQYALWEEVLKPPEARNESIVLKPASEYIMNLRRKHGGHSNSKWKDGKASYRDENKAHDADEVKRFIAFGEYEYSAQIFQNCRPLKLTPQVKHGRVLRKEYYGHVTRKR